MTTVGKKSFAVVALTACVLGLACCPLFFVLTDARSAFPPVFFMAMMPPYLVGSGFLLWRYLVRPRAEGNPILLVVGEVLGWVAVGVFLVTISDFNLQSTSERFGLTSVFFLVASTCALPIALLRETVLEARFARLCPPLVIGVVLLLLGLAATGAAVYFQEPQPVI